MSVRKRTMRTIPIAKSKIIGQTEHEVNVYIEFLGISFRIKLMSNVNSIEWLAWWSKYRLVINKASARTGQS